ncbi:uncharacterized protein TRIADDRAFT_21081, partial [Trichoplax adhaerens]
ISLLLFLIIYVLSYAIVTHFRKREPTEDILDNEDAVVNRIALWLCTFTLSTAIGAVLLLPVTILSNEVLLALPNSYYVKWLNTSLIYGLWKKIFFASNTSLLFLMPFAYFFTESEGFSGSRKGLKARALEAFIILILLTGMLLSFVWVILSTFGWNSKSESHYIPDIWGYLPHLYSGLASLGVMTLLVCTPLGLSKMFSVLGQLVVKPQFFQNLNEEIYIAKLKEETLSRKHSTATDGLRTELEEEFKLAQKYRMELERKQEASPLQRNLVYPFCLLILLVLTAISMLMVGLHCLELVLRTETVGNKPKYTIGEVSYSKLGFIGVFLQMLIIFYIMAASLVGLYNIFPFNQMIPQKKDSSMPIIIANCIVLLILSSALPLLSKILGITKFDLLGEFGQFDWLKNVTLTFCYNLLFEGATAFCLVTQITVSVRKALYSRLQLASFYKKFDKRAGLKLD